LQVLFDRYADNHHMSVYGQPSPELRALAESAHMTEDVAWFTYLDGLGHPPTGP
jgi:hypothetical protein